jgi:hypothetical protein
MQKVALGRPVGCLTEIVRSFGINTIQHGLQAVGTASYH